MAGPWARGGLSGNHPGNSYAAVAEESVCYFTDVLAPISAPIISIIGIGIRLAFSLRVPARSLHSVALSGSPELADAA